MLYIVKQINRAMLLCGGLQNITIRKINNLEFFKAKKRGRENPALPKIFDYKMLVKILPCYIHQPTLTDPAHKDLYQAKSPFGCQQATIY